jgi:glycosyltransferase involved in cell wall biosynthesis
MRVCFVALASGPLFDPSLARLHGGAELQVFLIAKSLAARGVAVSFVLEGGPDHMLDYRGPIEIHSIRTVGRGVPGVSRVVNRLRLERAIEQARPEVVVQTNAGGITGRAARGAHRCGARFIFRAAHDWDVDGSALRRVGDRAQYLRGLLAADAIVARNEHQGATFRERYGRDATVIPSAFPLPAAPPVVPKGHVLWVANSQQFKQPQVFLDLARALPAERFCMVMPKNDAAVFDSIAEQAGALPNVEFSSGVPYTEIQPYFDRAKVFVNTSTVEGFPNTFVQAAMGATPIVSLSVDPDGVLVVNGIGRCAQGDPRRLEHDLRRLLSDEPLRRNMGEAAFAYARRTHDIDRVTDLWMHLLDRVLS